MFDCALNKQIKGVRLDVNSVCVYVIGGGSYSEYETVMSVQSKVLMQMIYGCDYLYTPEEFVKELRVIH